MSTINAENVVAADNERNKTNYFIHVILTSFELLTNFFFLYNYESLKLSTKYAE